MESVKSKIVVPLAKKTFIKFKDIFYFRILAKISLKHGKRGIILKLKNH